MIPSATGGCAETISALQEKYGMCQQFPNDQVQHHIEVFYLSNTASGCCRPRKENHRKSGVSGLEKDCLNFESVNIFRKQTISIALHDRNGSLTFLHHSTSAMKSSLSKSFTRGGSCRFTADLHLLHDNGGARCLNREQDWGNRLRVGNS